MSGTSEGAKKARDRNLQNDPDYYRKIRQKRQSGGGGFKGDTERAKEAGRKGLEKRWGKKSEEGTIEGELDTK